MLYQFGVIENAVFHKYINKQTICYDIGAFNGSYTQLFSKLGKEVVAFEPSIYNIQKFKDNTFHLDNVRLFEVALHEKEYKVKTKFKDCSNGVEDKEQLIKYVRLDNFVKENKLPLPGFVKQDVESMESLQYNTFDFLFENRTILWSEWHFWGDKNSNAPQSYENNPGWVHKENGGYDFNNLKKWNYIMIGVRGLNIYLVPENCDYNNELHYEASVVIPKEMWTGL